MPGTFTVDARRFDAAAQEKQLNPRFGDADAELEFEIYRPDNP